MSNSDHNKIVYQKLISMGSKKNHREANMDALKSNMSISPKYTIVHCSLLDQNSQFQKEKIHSSTLSAEKKALPYAISYLLLRDYMNVLHCCHAHKKNQYLLLPSYFIILLALFWFTNSISISILILFLVSFPCTSIGAVVFQNH